MVNFNYGKIVNGNFSYAMDFIKDNGITIINPTKEKYLQYGYKPIVKTPQPQKDGFYYTPKYIDKATTIEVEWEEHEIKPEPEAENVTE